MGKATTAWLGTMGGPIAGLANQLGTQTIKLLNSSGFLEGVKEWTADSIGFFADWFKDDPIPATAGAAAVVLGGGLVIGGGGVILGAIGGAFTAIGGAALSAKAAISGLVGSAAAVGIVGLFTDNFDKITEAADAVFNFDWNISDADIKAIQQDYFNQFVEQSGRSLGEATGAIVCSAHPGLGAVEVDYELLAISLELLDDQAKDKVFNSLTELAMFTKRMALYLTFLEVYKNTRQWIKANVKTGIASLDDAIKAWGDPASESWSFATSIEEKKEEINATTLGKFSVAFLEGALDSCFDFTLTG